MRIVLGVLSAVIISALSLAFRSTLAETSMYYGCSLPSAYGAKDSVFFGDHEAGSLPRYIYDTWPILLIDTP